MKLKRRTALGITFSLILISATLTYSQEPVIQEKVTPETQEEPEILWLWGEVVSVDIAKGELLVKYLDYESEQEKQLTIAVDEKTTYENIKSIDEIKPEDDISVDYIVGQDAKNIARNIIVEKPEELEIIPEEETAEQKIEIQPSTKP